MDATSVRHALDCIARARRAAQAEDGPSIAAAAAEGRAALLDAMGSLDFDAPGAQHVFDLFALCARLLLAARTAHDVGALDEAERLLAAVAAVDGAERQAA